MSTAATHRAISRAPAGRARVPARAPRLSARRRVSSTAALRHPSHLGNTARGEYGAPVSAAGGRADEAEPGWYDVPATSNFIDVRSEEELRDVMRAAYGNERASTLLVVEFYGKWCNSCRRLYPRLRRLAESEQDVLFCKIDFDACKDLCRKLGVAKLPYFHVYNGSGSRLADFAASLDPNKFARLTDAIDAHRAPRCVLRKEKKDADFSAASETDAASSSLVKLHHVTINWYGGGEDVQIAGDVAGGWTHTLATRRTNKQDDSNVSEKTGPTHSAVAILPTGTYAFKFIVDGRWVAAASSIYPTVTDAAGNVNNEVFVGAAHWPFEWVRVPSAKPAGPPGRPESVPVARVAAAATRDATRPEAEIKNATSAPSKNVSERSRPVPVNGGSFLDARSDGPPLNETAMAPTPPKRSGVGAGSSYLDRKNDGNVSEKKSSPLAAPVSPGVARVEAATALSASSTPFDPAVRPPEGKATKHKAPEAPETPDQETWPKQIKASADDFSTRAERDAKVRAETAQAFRALAFRRNEKNEAARTTANVKPLGPYSAVSVAPSNAPVPVATPAPATRADLLTLEDRVRRLETILENHGIGTEDGWLREG